MAAIPNKKLSTLYMITYPPPPLQKSRNREGVCDGEEVNSEKEGIIKLVSPQSMRDSQLVRLMFMQLLLYYHYT